MKNGASLKLQYFILAFNFSCISVKDFRSHADLENWILIKLYT